MTAIEPGQSFTVEYGSGKRVNVIALGLRKQRELASIVKQLVKAEENKSGLDLFDLSEQSLRLAMPEVTDDFLDSIDAEMAIEIATKTLGKQALSEDEQKKSD